MTASRYAVYYTPPVDHPLTRVAAKWLGRSPFGRSPMQDAGEHPLTAEPRRYGFHATLAAPFRLNANCWVEDLEETIRGIARTCAPCRIGPLKIGMLTDFFALVPVDPVPGVCSIAARIVQGLDRFRAPLNESEMRRRLRGSLDEVERANLQNWGYPYVLDRFRFHMTLTDRVDPGRAHTVQQQLEELFLPLLAEDYYLDMLSLFVQAAPQADFRVRLQFPLALGDERAKT